MFGLFRVVTVASLVGGGMSLDSVKAVLERINSAYTQPSQLQMTATYRLYDTHEGDRLVDEVSSQVKRKGQTQFTSQPGSETLDNGVVSITVDHDSRIVVLGNALPTNGSSVMTEDITSTLGLASSITELTSGIRFSFDRYFYDHLDLFYDKETFYLEKITMYLNQNHELATAEMPAPRMEIVFEKPDTQSMVDSKLLEVTRYFQPGDGWDLNSAYSDYELMNLLN